PIPMPSEPSDGIFDAPAVYRRGAGAGKYPYRHCRYTVTLKPAIPDNTVISKPVIPAQAGIRTPDAAGIYRK
ncbi:hypothetical protein ACKXR0_002048, partial [Neisseria gonorrhoeae]